MRRVLVALAAALLLGSCSKPAASGRTEITLQRFFGDCADQYGHSTDVAHADGECGIMTTLVNRFQAENPDIRVRVQTVFWPGYDQLTAQLAANDAPDLVTMHASVIPDYRSRGLLEPIGDELHAAGVDPARFSGAARQAVVIDGKVYGLPWDTWAPLWHINIGLFRKAGLLRNGKPILPTNEQELIAEAEQFKRATGKPFLVQIMANEYAAFTRNLYTGLVQQGATIFTDDRHIRLTTPEARRVLALYKDIYDRGLTTKNLDYSAATACYLNGCGGVFLTGTWMVGTFDKESKTPGRPLSGGYEVVPYPNVFGNRDAWFIDGHNWVVPTDRHRTPAQRKAIFRLMRFLADHDGDWARTGHLPAYTNVLESSQFRALPHRSTYMELAAKGVPLPSSIRRQYPIETIVGEECAAAISGQKSIDRALSDAEARINDLLANI
jgi:multiple sugar transport system substrate-binding protein